VSSAIPPGHTGVPIAFVSHFSHFCFAFAHFFHLSEDISRLVHQEVVKNARIMRKFAKRKKKLQKCQKMRNANAMRKCNQNSHRIAPHSLTASMADS
jgi:hypothetical protein